MGMPSYSLEPATRPTAGGMVLKKQNINLFAGVTYENLRQEAAAGSGQYVSALVTLHGISLGKLGEFGLVLQWKHTALFAAGMEADHTAYLKLVSSLSRELATAVVTAVTTG